MRIALIRAGATDYDQQGRVQGTLNIPLCDEGTGEVAQVIDEVRPLGLELLYASGSLAAQQTAEAIAFNLSIKLKHLEKLHNVDQGLWQGMQIEELKRKHPKIYRQWEDLCENVCPPQGETLGEAKDRVQTALKKILKKNGAAMVGVVAPRPLFDLFDVSLTSGECGEPFQVSSAAPGWELLEPVGHAVPSKV